MGVPEEIRKAMQEYLLGSKAIFSNLDTLYSKFPALTLLFLRELLAEQSFQERKATEEWKHEFEEKLGEKSIDYCGREAILLGICDMLEKENGSVMFQGESSLQTQLSMKVLFSQFLSRTMEFEEGLEDQNFEEFKRVDRKA